MPQTEVPAVDFSLRHPSFVLFWIARVCTSLGFQMAVTAIGWFVYDRTRNAYDLGYLGLCQFLPIVMLTLVVGTLADAFDRRIIAILCQLVKVAAIAVLAFGIYNGWSIKPLIFSAVALIGAARAFDHPTLSALLPAIVPISALPRAVALSSSAMQTATILGPTFGGLLYAFGVVVPLGAASFLFIIAAVSLLLIRLEKRHIERSKVTLSSIFSGVTFIWRRPVIFGVISLDMFAVLLGGVTALLPIYARDILHAGPWGLGLLRSAPAIGALAVAGLLTRYPLGGRAGYKMFACVIVWGIATLVFAASTTLALSLAALIMMGASDNVSVVIRTSLVQLSTPDAMRGRVNAVNSLFIGTSNQLGEFESGMTAGLFGTVPAALLGGFGTILVALLWMRLFPGLRRLDKLDAILPVEPQTDEVLP